MRRIPLQNNGDSTRNIKPKVGWKKFWVKLGLKVVGIALK